MKVLSRKQINGRKVVVKQLENKKDMEKLNVTSSYVLLLDGEIEWEADRLPEIMEFMACEEWKGNL